MRPSNREAKQVGYSLERPTSNLEPRITANGFLKLKVLERMPDAKRIVRYSAVLAESPLRRCGALVFRKILWQHTIVALMRKAAGPQVNGLRGR